MDKQTKRQEWSPWKSQQLPGTTASGTPSSEEQWDGGKTVGAIVVRGVGLRTGKSDRAGRREMVPDHVQISQISLIFLHLLMIWGGHTIAERTRYVFYLNNQFITITDWAASVRMFAVHPFATPPTHGIQICITSVLSMTLLNCMEASHWELKMVQRYLIRLVLVHGDCPWIHLVPVRHVAEGQDSEPRSNINLASTRCCSLSFVDLFLHLPKISQRVWFFSLEMNWCTNTSGKSEKNEKPSVPT